MERILGHILSAPAESPALDGVDAWWTQHREVTAAFATPIERAIAGGFAADRPGYAFASGYQEALRHMLPSVAGRKVALCATEPGGNQPKQMQTRLEVDGDGFRMSGTKSYVTLGTYAEQLLVFAVSGVDDRGRNRIVAALIPSDRSGVSVEPLGPTPFVPEIPHARLALDGVRVEATERLDGDGYSRYLKPFRTIEDVHVYAALVAWVLGVGRRAGWPTPLLGELAAQLAACGAIARSDYTSSAVHVALGGLVATTKRLLTESSELWASVDDSTRAMWERDRVLLDVAGKARARRFEVAWERLTQR
jgi:hypothetical protein